MAGMSLRVRKVKQGIIRKAADELDMSVSSFIAEAIDKGLSGEVPVNIMDEEKGEVRISTIISSKTKDRIIEVAEEAGVRPTEWATYAAISYSEYVTSGVIGSTTRLLDDAFDEDALASHGMEYRRQQHALARAMHNQLSTGVIGLCEAGTGTGKAYAAIVAAASFAKSSGEKVVIATYTRALQRQLAETANVVNAVSGMQAKIAVVYGKQNYVSQPHLTAILNDKDIPIKKGDRDIVVKWMKRTKDWLAIELQELVDQGTFPMRLVTIPQDSNDAISLAPYRKAMDNASKADVIITSQHMLLYAMMNKNAPILGFIPENIIIDEAHLLEQAAASVLSSQLSFASAKWAVRKISSILRAQGKTPMAKKYDKWATHLDVLSQNILDGYDDEEVISLIRRDSISNIITSSGNSLKILSKVPRIPSSVKLSGPTLSSVREIKETVSVINQIIKASEKPAHYGSDIYATISPVRKYVRVVATSKWFIGKDIDRIIWSKIRSASLMSATIYLPVKNGESASEFINSVGLRDYTVHTEPPFFESWVHDNLAIHAVPASFPEPVSESLDKKARDAWLSATTNIINAINRKPVSDESGGILVLCTSYADADAIFKRMKKGKRKVVVYKRDDDMRDIQKQFAEADGKMLLIGLGGFWTGVDFPGRILTDCVITRMPIMSGTDPMLLSRFQYVKDRLGVGVAFSTILLTRMGRTLMQGIGRVIRHKTDRGRVFITDPRIHTRPKWRIRTLLRKYEPIIEIKESLYKEKSNGK